MSSDRKRADKLRGAWSRETYGMTSAAPTHVKYRPSVRDRYDTALKSGPVKTWANMTREEREKVLADLKGRK